MEQLKVDFNKVIESLKLSEKSINSRKENLNQFVENGLPNKRACLLYTSPSPRD